MESENPPTPAPSSPTAPSPTTPPPPPTSSPPATNDAPRQPATSEPPAAVPAPPADNSKPTETPKEPPNFDNPEAAKAAQKAAKSIHTKINTQAMTVRQYLEATVVPILMQGMQALVKERPEDPVEYLAAFLLKNNPNKKTEKEETEPQKAS